MTRWAMSTPNINTRAIRSDADPVKVFAARLKSAIQETKAAHKLNVNEPRVLRQRYGVVTRKERRYSANGSTDFTMVEKHMEAELEETKPFRGHSEGNVSLARWDNERDLQFLNRLHTKNVNKNKIQSVVHSFTDIMQGLLGQGMSDLEISENPYSGRWTATAKFGEYDVEITSRRA